LRLLEILLPLDEIHLFAEAQLKAEDLSFLELEPELGRSCGEGITTALLTPI
jgi:hypothetical protein